jgi:peptide/nickel transport system substrate-binding protein
MPRRQVVLIVVALAVVAAVAAALTGLLVWRLTTPVTAPAPQTAPAAAEATPSLPASTPATAAATAATMAARDVFVRVVGRAPTSFNPVFAIDIAAQSVIDLLLPRLLGQDPATGVITPTELATGWTIGDDGRTYTFALADDVRWSDGTPVTAADFAFTYAALADPGVASPYRDRTANLLRVETPDPATVVVTLARAECSVLSALRQPLLPAHLFAPDFSDLATHAFNRTPQVSAGPFRFVERLGDDRIILEANLAYHRGAPAIARYEVRVIPEPGVRSQALALGQVDLISFDPDELRSTGLPTGEGIAVYTAPADGYHFLALNLADPANPQPGRTAAGERQPQTPHPILGERAVREAIAAAIDSDTLLADLFAGHGYRPTTFVPPAATWAAAAPGGGNPSLRSGQAPLGAPPIAYDPVRAGQILDAAGWTVGTDGVRARGGVPLRLTLQTNADNPLRVRISEFVAAQLRDVGFDIVLTPLFFEELTAALLGQRYDLVVIGWENLGADPGNSPFWHSRDDSPGVGFNFTSFQDAEIDSLLDAALQDPTCDLARRAGAYRQVQARIQAELPYILLAGDLNGWAYATRWQGIAPGPWRFDHNVVRWQLP